MKMFIPKLGTELLLERDWHIKLVCESRNKSLWDMKCYPPMDSIEYHNCAPQSVNLKAGDQLKVIRIFIRKGSTMFNSVTFFGDVHHEGLVHRTRFWVTLDDFNKLEAKVVS